MKNLLILTSVFLTLMACNPSGNKAIIPLIEEEHTTSKESHKETTHNQKEAISEIKDSTSIQK
ncbi:MAG: hypothetical protein ACEQSF_02120 [Solirubrobacteraceae bacterium]